MGQILSGFEKKTEKKDVKVKKPTESKESRRRKVDENQEEDQISSTDVSKREIDLIMKTSSSEHVDDGKYENLDGPIEEFDLNPIVGLETKTSEKALRYDDSRRNTPSPATRSPMANSVSPVTPTSQDSARSEEIKSATEKQNLQKPLFKLPADTKTMVDPFSARYDTLRMMPDVQWEKNKSVQPEKP